MRPVRITNPDGTGAYDLTPVLVSWGVRVGTRAAQVAAAGATGAFDLHGYGRAPDTALELELQLAITAQSEEGLYIAVAQTAQAIMGPRWDRGLRRLYFQRGTVTAWGYCRALEQPQAEHEPKNLLFTEMRARLGLADPYAYRPLDTSWLQANGYTAVTLDPSIIPEQIAPDLVSARFTITASPTTIVLRHEGEVETRRILFRIASMAAGGMENPRLRNETTGQELRLALTGATASTQVTIYTAPALGRAQRTDNAGATWSDITPDLTLGTLQAVPMELAPGDNLITYSQPAGTPNVEMDVAWWHAYRIV